MSSTAAAVQIAEHVPGVAGGGILMLIVRAILDKWKGKKPVEESAHTVMADWAAFAASLGAELERERAKAEALAKQADEHRDQIYELREANHGLRNKFQKLMAYFDLWSRWAGRLEDQLRAEGIEPEPRPELPALN